MTAVGSWCWLMCWKWLVNNVDVFGDQAEAKLWRDPCKTCMQVCWMAVIRGRCLTSDACWGWLVGDALCKHYRVQAEVELRRGLYVFLMQARWGTWLRLEVGGD